MDQRGSVSRLLAQLRSPSQEVRNQAAALIWDRYSARLLALACQHLNQRLRRRVGSDDVVQSVFKSFFLRQQRGAYDLADRDDLLNLLMRMTLNKSRGAAKREGRRRRNYRLDETPSTPTAAPDEATDWLLTQLAGSSPTPAEAAELAEAAEIRLLQLSADLRRIVLYKLQGFTNAEIAALPELPTSIRTVERKLQLIREAWRSGDRP